MTLGLCSASLSSLFGDSIVDSAPFRFKIYLNSFNQDSTWIACDCFIEDCNLMSNLAFCR